MKYENCINEMLVVNTNILDYADVMLQTTL